MFKKHKRFTKLSLILLTLMGVIYISYIQDRHVKRYTILLEQHNLQNVRQEQQQVRYTCSKDLYKSEGLHRHHYHITAPYSTLLLTPKNKDFEVVEHIKNLKCFFTDSLHPEEEKEINATQGTYFYSRQKLLADDVSFRFNSKGLSPFTGHANHACLELSKETPLIFAEDFVAYTNNK